jgi:membrane associated rhomboid family serine protease
VIPLRDDNPTTHPPITTIVLIVSCALVFLWQTFNMSRMEQIVLMLGVTPAKLTGITSYGHTDIPALLTVVTSMFLHGGWMHLIGNMLFLWIFGNNVEDAMGHYRFILFYLLCGSTAVLAQTLISPDSMVPMIGASGAISGVLGAYLLLYPHARVLVLIPLGLLTRLIYLPALLVLGFWLVLQVISSLLADPNQPGIAFGAHVGGFIAGMLLIPLFKCRSVRLWNPRSD